VHFWCFFGAFAVSPETGSTHTFNAFFLNTALFCKSTEKLLNFLAGLSHVSQRL